MKKNFIKSIVCGLAAFAVAATVFAGSGIKAQAASPQVWYCAHVQNIGWQGSVHDGATTGTTGRGLQMEAVMVDTAGIDGGVTYRAHSANVGWQPWVGNKAVAGTTGRGLRMEAIEIKLTGNAANQYDVVYRAHVQNVGWQGWVKNGQTAGTTGQGLRMEALEVKLVAKSNVSNNNGGSTANKTVVSGSVNNFISDGRWAAGTSWGASHASILDPGMGIGCNAYCRDYTKYVYGKSLHNGAKYTSISNVRAGDCIYIGSGSTQHWAVVLGRNGNTLDLIHGNWTNGKVCRTQTTISGNSIFGRPFQFGYHY